MEEIFTIAGIGNENIIIGIDWLRHHNPKIGFEDGTMEFPDVPSLSTASTEIEDEEEQRIQQKLSECYWKYVDLFRKSKAERLPEHKDTDHVINLKPDFVPTKAKPSPDKGAGNLDSRTVMSGIHSTLQITHVVTDLLGPETRNY